MTRWSFLIFHWRGIPVRIHAMLVALLLVVATFFVERAGLSGLVFGLSLLLPALLCLFLHEIAHAAVARSRSVAVHAVVLGPLVNFTLLESEPQGPDDEGFIAAAGPAMNGLLFATLLGIEEVVRSVHPGSADLLQWLSTLKLVNFWMALGNLVPILPADGGRIVRAFLGRRHPYLVATRLAAKVGVAFLLVAVPVLALLTPLRSQPPALLLMLLMVVHLLASNRRAIQQALVRELKIQSQSRPVAESQSSTGAPRRAYRPLSPAQFERWRPLCESAARQAGQA